MQVGIITRHTNLSSRQMCCVLNLGTSQPKLILALCCEPCRVGRDMPLYGVDGVSQWQVGVHFRPEVAATETTRWLLSI
jgi:hypothetical protein